MGRTTWHGRPSVPLLRLCASNYLCEPLSGWLDPLNFHAVHRLERKGQKVFEMGGSGRPASPDEIHRPAHRQALDLLQQKIRLLSELGRNVSGRKECQPHADRSHLAQGIKACAFIVLPEVRTRGMCQCLNIVVEAKP